MLNKLKRKIFYKLLFKNVKIRIRFWSKIFAEKEWIINLNFEQKNVKSLTVKLTFLLYFFKTLEDHRKITDSLNTHTERFYKIKSKYLITYLEFNYDYIQLNLCRNNP